MTNQMSKPSTRTARLAGLLYLLLIPLGFFGMAYIPEVLVIPGDIATTMQNLVTSESLFRLSLASAFLMNLVMIALVLVLYQLFSPASKPLATFMVVFGLLGAGIAMLNEVNSFAVLMLSHLHAGAVFAVEQTQYLVELFLEMREFGASIAGIFWGLWLLPLGYLLIRYDLLTRIVGISLIIAGVGYVIDSFVLFLVPHYLVPISDYAFVGEVLFTLWLLFKDFVGEFENKANPEPVEGGAALASRPKGAPAQPPPDEFANSIFKGPKAEEQMQPATTLAYE